MLARQSHAQDLMKLSELSKQSCNVFSVKCSQNEIAYYNDDENNKKRKKEI